MSVSRQWCSTRPLPIHLPLTPEPPRRPPGSGRRRAPPAPASATPCGGGRARKPTSGKEQGAPGAGAIDGSTSRAPCLLAANRSRVGDCTPPSPPQPVAHRLLACFPAYAMLEGMLLLLPALGGGQGRSPSASADGASTRAILGSVTGRPSRAER